MTELEAARWIQDQPGLIILIGKDRKITLKDGCSVEATGIGLLNTVMIMQSILKQMRENDAS